MTSAVSTPRNVRAFIAVGVTEEARSALAALVEHLRRAQVRWLRPVDPNGIHLTLRFLGDVPESRIEPLTAEVSRVVSRHRPFTLHLSGAGAFPSGSRPRVLWVGLDGDLASQRRLYQQLGVALEELGFCAGEKRVQRASDYRPNKRWNTSLRQPTGQRGAAVRGWLRTRA